MNARERAVDIHRWHLAIAQKDLARVRLLQQDGERLCVGQTAETKADIRLRSTHCVFLVLVAIARHENRIFALEKYRL